MLWKNWSTKFYMTWLVSAPWFGHHWWRLLSVVATVPPVNCAGLASIIWHVRCMTTGSWVLSLWATIGNHLAVITESNSPREDDCDAIYKFDFEGRPFHAVIDFKRKCHFPTAAALGVVKMIVDVEKELSRKWSVTQMLTSNLLNESARNYLKFGCDGLLSHKLWKCDLVKGLANFDCCILIDFPRDQAELCCGSLYNSFSVRGWAPKKLRTIHVEETTDLMDDLLYGYVSYDGSEPEIGEWITFLCGWPQVFQKTYWQCFASVVFVRVIYRVHFLLYSLVRST